MVGQRDMGKKRGNKKRKRAENDNMEQGRRRLCEPGRELLKAAQEAGFGFRSECQNWEIQKRRVLKCLRAQ